MDEAGRVVRIAALTIVVLGVVALIWGSNRADWKPIFISDVAATSDSANLSVTVIHSQCRRGPRVQVIDESSDVVRLRAQQDEGSSCDDVGLTSEINVSLDTELGARRIELDEPGTSQGRVISCVVDGQVSDRCITRVAR